jgi:hypothetical protein
VGVTETRGDLIQAGWLPGIGLPGKHWLPYRGLDWRKPYPTRGTGPLAGEQIAIWGAGPGQPLATAPLGLAPPSHALSNPCACVCGPGRAHWQEPLIMRGLTHGPLDKGDRTAALRECIDHEPLMDVMAREAIGGRAQAPLKGRHGSVVAEPVVARTVELAPALAIIAIARLVGAMPLGLGGDRGAQATAWLRNRLRLWLTTRGDTDVESAFHGFPPDDALAQARPLRCVPSPIAEGPGMHTPTVVPRHAVRPWCGAPASASA